MFFRRSLQAIGLPTQGSQDDLEAFDLACKLHELDSTYKQVLAVVHYRHFAATVAHFKEERSFNGKPLVESDYVIQQYFVNPDHLYFVLGELPFVTGKIEQARQDIFGTTVQVPDIIKDLFRDTREEYSDSQDEIGNLSPGKIQIALTFLRNLTVQAGSLVPNLFDILEAAKGVGGNSFALKILKNAKYYPYLPYENSIEFCNIGIDQVVLPNNEHYDSVNLFRDSPVFWRSVSIKPDPTDLQKLKYRYTWDPYGMCSHTPEDTRIESFNSYIRNKALKILNEDFVKVEKFQTSVKDGIDIRETLRNWHTGSIYVKELPPSKGKLDSVVIIFDDNHDEKYSHAATWFAEHEEESTLSFYATDPFENLIGPGIARCFYGGLWLLFPPRTIPNVFELTQDLNLPNQATQLVYGALLFSREKCVAYVSDKKPTGYMRQLAQKFKRSLVWIPLSSFSSETIQRLRRFHVLNGKIVRSWASRFIG